MIAIHDKMVSMILKIYEKMKEDNDYEELMSEYKKLG